MTDVRCTPLPHRSRRAARAVAIRAAGSGRHGLLAGAGLGLLLLLAAASAATAVHRGWPMAWLPPDAAPVTAPTGTGGGETGQAARLVRSTLMTLHDANRTGNYSVLRDLAAPPFQAANAPDQLASIFAAHRAAGLDLSVAASEAPRWDAPPEIGKDGLLRLKGHYETDRWVLRFALMFAPLLLEWRLMEVSVVAEPRRRVISSHVLPRDDRQPE